MILPMGRTTERLAAMGIELPASVAPVANYVPARIVGSLLYLSGQIPMMDGSLCATGSVPSSVDVETATAAARQCAINVLAAASEALDGDLDRIDCIVQVRVYVACEPGFTQQSTVANGASDLLAEVLGDAGRHTRVAIGSVALPMGATVEVEALMALREAQ